MQTTGNKKAEKKCPLLLSSFLIDAKL
jgi:hypothetical protein